MKTLHVTTCTLLSLFLGPAFSLVLSGESRAPTVSCGSYAAQSTLGTWGKNPKDENSTVPCVVKFLLLSLL